MNLYLYNSQGSVSFNLTHFKSKSRENVYNLWNFHLPSGKLLSRPPPREQQFGTTPLCLSLPFVPLSPLSPFFPLSKRSCHSRHVPYHWDTCPTLAMRFEKVKWARQGNHVGRSAGGTTRGEIAGTASRMITQRGQPLRSWEHVCALGGFWGHTYWTMHGKTCLQWQH